MNKVYIVYYYVTDFLGRDNHYSDKICDANDLKRLLEKLIQICPTISCIKEVDECLH